MSSEFPQFEKLPPELQKEILTWDRFTAASALRIASKYPALLAKDVCENSITNREIAQYLSKHNVYQFMLFEPASRKIKPKYTDTSNLSVTTLYNLSYPDIYSTIRITGEAYFPRYEYSGIKAGVSRDHSFLLSYLAKEKSITYYPDVLTAYRIYLNRKPCQTANYAKNATRVYFNDIVQYHTDLGGRYLVDLYCYLAGHVWILHLDINISKHPFTLSLDRNGQIVYLCKADQANLESGIEMMINKIQINIDSFK